MLHRTMPRTDVLTPLVVSQLLPRYRIRCSLRRWSCLGQGLRSRCVAEHRLVIVKLRPFPRCLASLDQCAASGYPIQGIDVNTLPTSSISVSVETIPPESRTDITYSSGSITLPAPVTRASSSASGAGASASSTASSVASSVNSAAAGTGTALSTAVSSAAASATDAAGSAAAFAKVSGSVFALAVVAIAAMAL